MSGRYTIRTAVHGAFSDSEPNVFQIKETTIAQRLKSASYATAAVGKWHLGIKQWRYASQERGFDSFFDY
jgi:arylsulfatase